MASDRESLQARLVELLAERERLARRAWGDEAVHLARVDRELAAVAEDLRLTVDEVLSLTPAQVEELRRPPVLEGRFRIYRRARDFLPFLIGLVLVPIFSGLGASRAAAALLVVVVVAFVIHLRRRLAVFEVDPLGELSIRRVGRIDWADVDVVSYRLRHVWLEPHRGTGHATGVTAKVRFHRREGRTLRLAQGQLFQVRPVRRPVTFDTLSRYLRRRARQAGLQVQRFGGDDDGWEARRS